MVYRTVLPVPATGLRREIDRIVQDVLGGELNGNRAAWAPSVDIEERKDEMLFRLDIPGVRPEDVDVTLEKGVLTIRGEMRTERKENDDAKWHLVERSYGSFERAFRLPDHLDDERVEASFEHGVLTVRAPKAPAAQPRRIAVKV
ncbi:MAG TPA: Hsp20/alpha crystallin family protein [Gemmatimonadaceae bacterium]|nr:Hsp20/alpha crystallin family protein [Gemmatimonadaceae bacterium]